MKKALLLILTLTFSCFSAFAQTITVNSISGTSFCAGSTIQVTFSVTGVYASGNIFTIQLSDASGNFTPPTAIGTLIGTNGGTAFANIPAATPAGTAYKIRVVSNDPVVTSTNTSATFSVLAPAGVPSTFGNNVWRAYSYIGNNFEVYGGYYDDPNLNLNSATFWSVGASPSSAVGYVGCAIPANDHSVSYKRQGFPCGLYTISAILDDQAHLFIDGINVFSRTTTGTYPNIWTGTLNSNSTIEYRIREFTGN